MDKSYYNRKKAQMEQSLKKLHIKMVQSGSKPERVNAFNEALGKFVKFTEQERLDKVDVMSDKLLKGADGKERCPLCQAELSPTDFQVEKIETEVDQVELRLLRCPGCSFCVYVGKEEDEDSLKNAEIRKVYNEVQTAEVN